MIEIKDVNCCPVESIDTNEPTHDRTISTNDPMAETERCVRCHGKGRAVSRKTVLLMVKPDLLERAMAGNYSFCPERDCSIVYFDDLGGPHFTVDDLRTRVGLKVKDDPVPLCYCFGFDEHHIREELTQKGSTTIADRISSLIREGLCACDTRNPAGVCCLGEVNRAAKRLESLK